MGTILWFRDDLRLADNAALSAASADGNQVLPVYIADHTGSTPWEVKGAARWWLLHSLRALDADLRRRGSALFVAVGHAPEVLATLCLEHGATSVFLQRGYTPRARALEAEARSVLDSRGIETRTFSGGLLHAPDSIATQSGDYYKVFTPFFRRCMQEEPPAAPLPAPARLDSSVGWARFCTESRGMDAIANGIVDVYEDSWRPGEASAREVLDQYSQDRVFDYDARRDFPGIQGTSRISAHLRFGEVSPRQVLHAVHAQMAQEEQSSRVGAAEAFIRQLYWREFSAHLLWHRPESTDEPLRREFERFPWRTDYADLARWQQGETGYPYIDAGMRELLATGWMHNRVRMAVASFLVKDLLIPWQEGARWFWERLVDADLANNTMGWQWVAGCGADAAPYHRVFNPVTQGEKFDADGTYVRRWVPELAKLPNRHLHAPWNLPQEVLAHADVRLGENYPRPMVDHARARLRALEMHARIQGHAATR
jgi:deoxyribodipyrimidine photo-lyase